MNVGQAVYVDGYDDPKIISQFHDNGSVTVRDLDESMLTVDESEITEV